MAYLQKHELSKDTDLDTDHWQAPTGQNYSELPEVPVNMKAHPAHRREQIDSGVSSMYSRSIEPGSLVDKISDSGVLSMGSRSFESVEESPDSGQLSMGSRGIEPDVSTDKIPVQCSDAGELEQDLFVKKFGDLKVADADEGIESFRSEASEKSLESMVSEKSADEDPSEIEIDLYERDDDGDTFLHVAVVNLLKAVALVFIDICVDVKCLNIQNYLSQTPLHLAVLTGQTEIVKSLLAKGANATLRDQQGNTPLHIACRTGDKDAVSLLVQSVDAKHRKKYFAIKNCEGLTCLHVAAQAKEYIILGHLFAKGADVNIGDAKSGRTMLHYAAERKDIDTIVLLLTHPDIDVDCRTFKGETPLVLAFWRNYQDIVKRLRNKGASFSYDMVEDLDDETCW